MTGQVGHDGDIPKIRCVTIKAVGGSDQINDIINPIKYHRDIQQYEQIPQGIGASTPTFLYFFSSLFTLHHSFPFFFWLMDDANNCSMPDATDEGSPRKSLVALFPAGGYFSWQVPKKT